MRHQRHEIVQCSKNTVSAAIGRSGSHTLALSSSKYVCLNVKACSNVTKESQETRKTKKERSIHYEGPRKTRNR